MPTSTRREDPHGGARRVGNRRRCLRAVVRARRRRKRLSRHDARASQCASSTRASASIRRRARVAARSRGYRSRITLGANALAALDATARELYAQRERERRIEDASRVEHMHALAALIAKECGIDDLSAVKGLKN